jgi:cytochrome c553
MRLRLRQAPRGAASALLAIAFAGSAATAAAQTAMDVSVLAGSCANCHGTDGRSRGPMPPLAGRPEADLAAKLRAFRSDPPPAGTTIMGRLAKGYTVAELDALAKHFAQLKAQPVAATQPAAAKRGGKS